MSSPVQVGGEGNKYIRYRNQVDDVLTLLIKRKNLAINAWKGKGSEAFFYKGNKVVQKMNTLSEKMKNTNSEFNSLANRIEEELRRREAAASSQKMHTK